MWRAPNRPKNEISQSFNDGVLTVYKQTDTAKPGHQPKPTLTPKITLRYEERRLGIQRYYSAAQNQVRVERVVRTAKTVKVSSQDIAMTEDGQTYRIDLVQTVPDVYPPCVDLTLVRHEQKVQVGR